DDRLLEELTARLDELKTDKHPFTEKPPVERKTTWLKPELVAEVKFAEVTPDGSLRAPVFLRLRDDAKPKPRKGVRALFPRAAKEKGSDPISGVPISGVPISGEDDAEAKLILAALEGKDEKVLVKVRGEHLSFTNLSKVMWP